MCSMGRIIAAAIYTSYLNVLPEWDEWGVLYNNTERVNSLVSSSGAHNQYIILVQHDVLVACMAGSILTQSTSDIIYISSFIQVTSMW